MVWSDPGVEPGSLRRRSCVVLINRVLLCGMRYVNGQDPDNRTGGAGVSPNPAPVSDWHFTEDSLG